MGWGKRLINPLSVLLGLLEHGREFVVAFPGVVYLVAYFPERMEGGLARYVVVCF